MLDQMREDEPHPAGRERAGRAEKDRRVAREHLFPDAARRRQVASLKRHPFHLREHFVGRESGGDREGLDRLAQETRFATAHASVILSRVAA
jgi:hypothetical protein